MSHHFRLFLNKYSLLFSLLTIFNGSVYGEPCDFQNFKSIPIENFFKGPGEGLSQTGINLVFCFRSVLKQHKANFEKENFSNMGEFYHATVLARLIGQHVFIQGAPGGAKSKFVNFFQTNEGHPTYIIQMSEATQAAALQGGYIFAELQNGITKFNTEKNILRFKTIAIDEIDKASPSTLTTLLSALQERCFMNGADLDCGDLETAYATSNAFIPSIIANFNDIGRKGTGEALLNRFIFKMFFSNWQKRSHLADILLAHEKKGYRQRKPNSNTADSLKIGEWFTLVGQLTDDLVTFMENNGIQDNTNYLTLSGFLDDIRKATNQKYNLHLSDSSRSLGYYPSADLSTRSTIPLISIMKASLFVDLLLSNEPLDDWLSSPIEMDISSLWRLHLVLGTLIEGKTSFSCTRASVNTGRNTFFPQCKFSQLFDGTEKIKEGAEKQFVTDILDEKRLFSQEINRLLQYYKAAAHLAHWSVNDRPKLELVLGSK